MRSFACEDLKPLVVCRGPIRKEAMDVFEEMGIAPVRHPALGEGLDRLPDALAPELRQLPTRARAPRAGLHRRDEGGARRADDQIVGSREDNGYDSVFAGYGFMAEDEEFVATIEQAGLKFIGPNSVTQARAGKKDEAKRTALAVGNVGHPGRERRHRAHAPVEAQDAQGALALVDAEELACDPRS